MNTYLKLCVCILCVCLTSCSFKTKDEKKIKDLDFEVIEQENIPEELKKMIDERKGDEFDTTFEENEDLYIVKGYGKVSTGGYSVCVKELYEGEKNTYVKFCLIGPSKEEKVIQKQDTPYIVIKLKKVASKKEYSHESYKRKNY